MADETITGCIDWSTNSVKFDQDSCTYTGCIIWSGVHAGQVAVTVVKPTCEDTYYADIDYSTGAWQLTLPDNCCVPGFNSDRGPFCGKCINDTPEWLTLYFSGSTPCSGHTSDECGHGWYHALLQNCDFVGAWQQRWLIVDEGYEDDSYIGWDGSVDQFILNIVANDDITPSHSRFLFGRDSDDAYDCPDVICDTHDDVDQTGVLCGVPSPRHCYGGTVKLWAHFGTAWAEGVSYAVDKVVYIGGVSYICTAAHTSSLANQPPGAFWGTWDCSGIS